MNESSKPLSYDHLVVSDVYDWLREFVKYDEPWLLNLGAMVKAPTTSVHAERSMLMRRRVLDVHMAEVPQLFLDLPRGRLVLRTKRGMKPFGGDPYLTWAVVLVPLGANEAAQGGAIIENEVEVTTHTNYDLAKRDFINRIDPVLRLSAAALTEQSPYG